MKITINPPPANLREVKRPTDAQIADALRVLRDYHISTIVDDVITNEAETEDGDMSPTKLRELAAEYTEDSMSYEWPVVEWVSAVCDNGLADTITRFEA